MFKNICNLYVSVCVLVCIIIIIITPALYFFASFVVYFFRLLKLHFQELASKTTKERERGREREKFKKRKLDAEKNEKNKEKQEEEGKLRNKLKEEDVIYKSSDMLCMEKCNCI